MWQPWMPIWRPYLPIREREQALGPAPNRRLARPLLPVGSDTAVDRTEYTSRTSQLTSRSQAALAAARDLAVRAGPRVTPAHLACALRRSPRE